MSYAPVPREGSGGLDYSYYEDDRGYGLVTFAGVMLTIAAVLNTLYGIAAITKAHVFVANAHYVFGNLSTWGWFVLALGILQFFAAFAIWRGVPWGRWFGVVCASLNAILQTLWIPAYPILAITILTRTPPPPSRRRATSSTSTSASTTRNSDFVRSWLRSRRVVSRLPSTSSLPPEMNPATKTR